MHDFVSSGWGYYIAILTILSLAFCLWLCLSMDKVKAKKKGEKVDTTGHTWDEDLQELNNPLPRWWLYLFYITIATAVLYLILYPGLGAVQGGFRWTQAKQYEAEVKAANARYAPIFAQYTAQSIEEVAKDPQARATGEHLFLTYCAQCHGSDARGSKGFPNLSDANWLYGGAPETIRTTITNGRHGIMPALGPAAGGQEGVESLAHYVRSLSGAKHDAAKATLGKEKFALCASCHGADGSGNPMLGAPNLTDSSWLYGGSVKTISQTITNGRDNQMPAFGELLGDDKIHVLSAYIWSLSNIEQDSEQ